MAGFEVAITLIIALTTAFCTTLAGLPASLVANKFQGIMIIVLVLILTLALTTQPAVDVSRENFDRVSNFTGQGTKAFVTLTIAIVCAEMFSQAAWQRVWAAESVPAMRRGFLVGSVMMFFLMLFFGILGMIGKCGSVVFVSCTVQKDLLRVPVCALCLIVCESSCSRCLLVCHSLCQQP
jgi:solute:Na+ symporter, SSS family